MDDTPCHRFFLEPSSTAQRQYEALRAVFVEGGCQKEVAERFGYSYAAFRQLVHQFRGGCRAGQPPPLFHLPSRGRPPRR
jgi:transposase